jgi:hypothetical protein
MGGGGMSKTRDTDYANAHRVRAGHTQYVRVPAAVLGQIASELDDGGQRYVKEALGPLLVDACVEVAYRDDTTMEGAA